MIDRETWIDCTRTRRNSQNASFFYSQYYSLKRRKVAWFWVLMPQNRFVYFLRQIEGVEFEGNGPAPLSWGTNSSIDSSDLTAQSNCNREEVTCTDDCETTSGSGAIEPLLCLLPISSCLCGGREKGTTLAKWILNYEWAERRAFLSRVRPQYITFRIIVENVKHVIFR